MLEVRCSKCHRLLLKEDMRDGEIEIKCHKCNTFNTVSRRIVIQQQTSKTIDTDSWLCNSKNKKTVKTVFLGANSQPHQRQSETR